MKDFFGTIDALLRGRLTRREELAAGRIDVPVATLVLAGVLMGVVYGASMGLFSALQGGADGWKQFAAAVVKVPLLFFLTLLVTYPSLYVVSALFDSRLRHGAMLRLLLVAMGANLALLASLGPVTAFFTLCTDSYAFMVVLSVVFFGVCGLVGLAILRRALDSVFEPELVDERPPSRPQQREIPAPNVPSTLQAQSLARAAAADDASGAATGHPTIAALPSFSALERFPAPPSTPPALRVFRFWIVIYGVVGAQMGWVLRPFVGAPSLPFEFFRKDRESNFFQAVLAALEKLFA